MTHTSHIRLGEACSFKAGGAFPTRFQGARSGDYPFIKVSDMNMPENFWHIRTAENWISEGTRAKLRSPIHPCGATVFAKIGIALQSNRRRLLTMPTLIDNNMMSATPKPDVVDSTYFYYLLRTLDFNEIATGTSLPFLRVQELVQIETDIPPMPAQRKIASILSAYDDLIENNLRRIKILEEMAQLLYQEWFVNFRFPGHKKIKMVDSPLGKIPEGWTVFRLGDIVSEVRRGVSPEAVDPDTPYIGLEHMPRKSIALSDWGKAGEVQSMKLAFKRGEILFGKIRPYFHKVGVAPVDGVCSTDAIVLVAKTEDVFPVILGCVASDQFVAHATQTSQGTKMPRASWNVLAEYPVVVPASPILLQFDEFVISVVAEIMNLVLSNRILRKTRDLLLPKLISGEPDVSDLDIKVREDMG